MFRFIPPKNSSMTTRASETTFKQNLTYDVKRITSDKDAKEGKPDIYQVTTDTHKETDLSKLKKELERFNIFSVLDKTNEKKEPALLVVKDKSTFTFEEVLGFAAKPK